MSLRHPRAPSSVRSHLAALALVTALPLALLQVRSGVDLYRASVREGEGQAMRLAEATATSTEQFLAVSEDLLRDLAAAILTPIPSEDVCRTRVEVVNAATRFFANVIVVDATGAIVCSALPTVDPGYTAAGRDWFEAAQRAGGFSIGAPVRGQITKRWVVALAVPILGADGTFLGALATSVALANFQQLLAGVEVAEDEVITIADRNRIVVARSNDAETWVGKALPPAADTERPIDPGRSITEAEDFTGEARTWAKIELPSAGWSVYAGIPSARIRGPALATAARQVGTGLLILLVAAAAAWLVAQRISVALHELLEGARRAADGSPLPVPGSAPAEVVELAEQLRRSFEARSRAESSERRAKERYRSIVDDAVFGIYISTLDGRFVEVNPAMVSMLGYDSSEELEALPTTALYRKPGVRERILETALATAAVDNVEVEWVTKSDKVITVRLNGRLIEIEGGRSAFEVIVEDITGQRELEEEFRHTQKMEAIGRLAGGVAHDFNNLLTVVTGNSHLVLADLADDDPLRPEIQEIAGAAARAEGLTRQLLAFSRKERSRPRLINPNELLQGLEKMLSRLIGEDVLLHTLYDAAVRSVFVDPGHLEQVVMNLAVNARDAMPQGGKLTLQTRWVRFLPGAERDGQDGWVVLSVEDDGVGMDAETRERIFEPFFTTKRKGEGTGLGLATAYGIVKSAGGHFLVDSAPDLGARFEVWLPAGEGRADRDDDLDVPSEARPGNGTILVAEDEEPVRRLVCRILQGSGYRVLVASDGAEGMRVSDQFDGDIDLVVTDVVMPNVRGTELADHITATRPRTPVLFVSGYTDNLPVQERLIGDPDLFMQKPFTPSQLRTRVQSLLDRHAAPLPR